MAGLVLQLKLGGALHFDDLVLETSKVMQVSPQELKLKYLDDDNDVIVIGSQAELDEAARVHAQLGVMQIIAQASAYSPPAADAELSLETFEMLPPLQESMPVNDARQPSMPGAPSANADPAPVAADPAAAAAACGEPISDANDDSGGGGGGGDGAEDDTASSPLLMRTMTMLKAAVLRLIGTDPDIEAQRAAATAILAEMGFSPAQIEPVLKRFRGTLAENVSWSVRELVSPGAEL
eukprot:TRINITY_DN119_c0_g1_i1.p1 TRINITY_DN119_c0_g1~~TRINITY_DN119_c0_g1_i1.p1  ORF type:complete len:237 (+),score=95.22 TRINITY_DN119_c0_g1_i1:111-821(+)